MPPYPEATVSYGCQASLALICLLGFSDLDFQDHVKQIYTFAAHLTMSTHSLAGLCWDKPAICHLIKWHASEAAASQLVWTDLCLHIWTGQGSLAPYPGHARGFSLGVALVCNVATKLRGEKGFIAKKSHGSKFLCGCSCTSIDSWQHYSSGDRRTEDSCITFCEIKVFDLEAKHSSAP